VQQDLPDKKRGLLQRFKWTEEALKVASARAFGAENDLRMVKQRSCEPDKLHSSLIDTATTLRVSSCLRTVQKRAPIGSAEGCAERAVWPLRGPRGWLHLKSSYPQVFCSL